MRKTIGLFIMLFLCFAVAGCADESEEPKEVEPQISQMKSICELATMKCYYHNVAKYLEEDASGMLWWTKDREFWIEYAGIVTIGIDTSKVKMKVQDDTVTITIPQAQVLGCKVDETTLTEDSFIVAKGSAAVEAEHQTAAFQEAQTRMQESASSDTALLANAQQRAQKLLEDYVHNIGDSMGKAYKIKWIYLEGDEPTQPETTDKATEESAEKTQEE